MSREVRSLPLEIRIRRGEDGKRTLVSTAPPWDTLSQDLGGFRERFARGAFGDLDEADIISTVEHDGRMLIGRTPLTLRLEDTDEGLRYEVDLPDTSAGRDLAELVERGDIRGSSFEFSVESDGDDWEQDDEVGWIRTVRSARLYQVGPVTNPAYQDGTQVALRSLDRVKAERRDVEEEDVPDKDWQKDLERKRRQIDAALML